MKIIALKDFNRDFIVQLTSVSYLGDMSMFEMATISLYTEQLTSVLPWGHAHCPCLKWPPSLWTADFCPTLGTCPCLKWPQFPYTADFCVLPWGHVHV